MHEEIVYNCDRNGHYAPGDCVKRQLVSTETIVENLPEGFGLYQSDEGWWTIYSNNVVTETLDLSLEKELLSFELAID